jgi:hypothetical protein
MRMRLLAASLPFIFVAAAALGQEPPAPGTPTSPPPPVPTTPPQATPPLSPVAASGYDRRDAFPNVNVYLPEGTASIRLRKLIRNVLFESQIDYKFVTGDISTFLRYKYYAKNFTYKIGVFDSISFGDIGSRSSEEFERVRGGLLLIEVPRDYNHRYFGLLQDDRLTFGDVTRVDNRKNNIYTKLGYQYGTEFDERLNAIVGESRGRLVPVLTAFRQLGPQKFSLAAALTESAKISTGDYQYTKLESEAIRRWDVSPTSFIVTRAHIGTFLTKQTLCGAGSATPQIECYSIPGYEMFRLGGREALRSISNKEDAASGTHELHVTNEYFVPLFRNRDYTTGPVHWNTAYAIAYAGTGNVGFETRDLLRTRDFAIDAGLGSELALTVRDFDVLLSFVFAHTIRGPEARKGDKIQFSIHTVR